MPTLRGYDQTYAFADSIHTTPSLNPGTSTDFVFFNAMQRAQFFGGWLRNRVYVSKSLIAPTVQYKSGYPVNRSLATLNMQVEALWAALIAKALEFTKQDNCFIRLCHFRGVSHQSRPDLLPFGSDSCAS